MPTLNVTDRGGDERTVEAVVGWSVMEIIRDNGFDELMALCGELPPSEWSIDYDSLDRGEPAPISGPAFVRNAGSFCIRAGMP